MKKIAIVLCIAMVLMLAGCTQSMRVHSRPAASDLPEGFEYVSEAGNGYYLYQAAPGYFLVSQQKQGSAIGHWAEANVFIDMVYIGKDLIAK